MCKGTEGQKETTKQEGMKLVAVGGALLLYCFLFLFPFLSLFLDTRFLIL